jgi:hypothetical protein
MPCRVLFAYLGAFCLLSCTELNARWNDHQVFFGTVRDSANGVALTTFCADTSVDRAEVIVFSAPVGSVVEEEVFVEGRTEKYKGDTPPERDGAFWCSDVPQVYLHPLYPWVCLRAADDDPPATILAAEPRGEIADNGSSSGYALDLEVRHAGILRVVFDADCLREHADPSSDAGVPAMRAEMTISTSGTKARAAGRPLRSD